MIRYALDYEWSYCHYITENDLPLKTMDSFDYYFELNSVYNFVDFAPENYSFAYYKCDLYHFFVENQYYRKSKLLKVLNHGCARFQKMIGIKRYQKNYKHGSAYFSISRAFARYILSKEKMIINEYRHTLGADEVWLQTLCEDSPFKNTIKYFERGNLGNLRLIDWSRRVGNSPHTFEDADFDLLIDAIENSPLCFARKFGNDSPIAIKIYEYLCEHTKQS